MNIPYKFCKAGCHLEVKTIGELIEVLKELPSDLRIDPENCVPVVYNVTRDPFFKMESEDFI